MWSRSDENGLADPPCPSLQTAIPAQHCGSARLPIPWILAWLNDSPRSMQVSGEVLFQKILRWIYHGSEASFQSSGGKGTPQMFRGLSNSIPKRIGFSGSMYTTWALARLSVKYT
jgi:hypothetical protein